MGSILDQRNKAKLRERALTARGRGTTKRSYVGGRIRDIQGAAVQADQTHAAVPGTLGALNGNGADQVIMQFTNRLPSKAFAGLGNP